MQNVQIVAYRCLDFLSMVVGMLIEYIFPLIYARALFLFQHADSENKYACESSTLTGLQKPQTILKEP